MPFAAACPSCDARLQAPDAVRGKRVKCKKCGEAFVARPADEDEEDDRPSRPAAQAAARPRPRPVADGDEDDRPARRPARTSRRADDDADRPRRRRRDEEDEDEPRPRRKKGKKSKTGSPVLLIVLIAAGALVLIGGGLGVYLAFFKQEKPGQLVAPGDGLALPVGKGGPRGVAEADPGAWVEVHEPEGRYRVKFPTAPERETRAGAEATVVMYRARTGADGFLAVHRPLPADAQGPGNKDRLIDQFLDLAKFPAPVQASDRKDITYQSFKGREMFLQAPGKRGGVAIRVIIAGDRVIGLGVLGDTVSAGDPRIKQFFESLKIE